MRQFNIPVVVVSKCLGFAHCRYNGQTIPDEFVERLKPHVAFMPVCPEVEIGLGVPRDPIRVVAPEGVPRLWQPATGRDVTAEMEGFAARFLGGLGAVDGFLLKNRSPSCGINDVRIYHSRDEGAASSRGRGLFGGAVVDSFGDLAIEDEGRLKNFRLRQHFLTKLFALADFREVKRTRSMGELVRFQADNKLLLMAYHQAEMREMGRIVANRDKRPVAEALAAYEQHLGSALARPARCTNHINVLMHALGYFSEGLSGAEKAFFLESLQRYRNGQLPIASLISLVGSWIVRFREPYLTRQTYFDPYPQALIDLADSGKELACSD
jgi:uncharacterized protein YbgA (DUF1722 family)/uncharacterized protein YbbK (DUF523 family)